MISPVGIKNALAGEDHWLISVEQFALIMAALMNYRRLLPHVSDHSDQPIKGSYLADLDALLRGDSHGNSRRVLEQMVFVLVRVLPSFMDQFKALITFLEPRLPSGSHVWTSLQVATSDLHIEAACKVKRMLSMSVKPPFAKNLSNSCQGP